MTDRWQVDIATSESDRTAGRVQIDAWSPLFDRRRIALVDRKEDATRIVSDRAIATAARAYREAWSKPNMQPYGEMIARREALFAAIDGETQGEAT